MLIERRTIEIEVTFEASDRDAREFLDAMILEVTNAASVIEPDIGSVRVFKTRGRFSDAGWRET